MTWTQLLANNEVQRHNTSKKELDKLRAVIHRDLADASLDAASADRRFATAYNAAIGWLKRSINYRWSRAGQLQGSLWRGSIMRFLRNRTKLLRH